jgi:hypothetical protein
VRPVRRSCYTNDVPLELCTSLALSSGLSFASVIEFFLKSFEKNKKCEYSPNKQKRRQRERARHASQQSVFYVGIAGKRVDN